MYAWYGNIMVSLGVGWALCLLWHYPLSIGLEKAIVCTKRLSWIRAGRHPKEEVDEIEKEYTKVLSGHFDQPQVMHQQPRSDPFVVKESKENPVYGSGAVGGETTSNGVHRRVYPDVEKQEMEEERSSTSF